MTPLSPSPCFTIRNYLFPGCRVYVQYFNVLLAPIFELFLWISTVSATIYQLPTEVLHLNVFSLLAVLSFEMCPASLKSYPFEYFNLATGVIHWNKSFFLVFASLLNHQFCFYEEPVTTVVMTIMEVE